MIEWAVLKNTHHTLYKLLSSKVFGLDWSAAQKQRHSVTSYCWISEPQRTTEKKKTLVVGCVNVINSNYNWLITFTYIMF